MGRGVRDSRARTRRGTLKPRARLVIGQRARVEFTADLRYIRRQGQKGARTVLGAVNTAIQSLRHYPDRGRLDEDAEGVPEGSRARKISTTGYVIRYLYPVSEPHRRRKVLLILSIRDGAQLPISDEDFLRRYAEEQARLRLNQRASK